MVRFKNHFDISNRLGVSDRRTDGQTDRWPSATPRSNVVRQALKRVNI